jgi:hypothetical protein
MGSARLAGGLDVRSLVSRRIFSIIVASWLNREPHEYGRLLQLCAINLYSGALATCDPCPQRQRATE